MRKVLAVICAAALIVVGVSVASVASGSSGSTVGSSPVLFRDYFNSPSDSNWTFYNRDGRIADGRLWIDGGYKSDAIGRDGWALTHVGDMTWKNYTYSVAYDNENWGPETTVYFRVAKQDPAATPTTTYRLDIWAQPTGPNSDCSGDNGYVQMAKIVNGNTTWVASACASNAVVGTNQLQIVALGNTFNAISNGQTVLSYTDPSPIPYGGVGVGQIWETNGWFDNVSVSRSCSQDGNSQC